MIYPSSGCADGILGDHALLAPPYIVSAADVEMIVERFAQAVDDAIAQAGV
jgi:adenosylmethionine-8-amino-7-oxononanoate aminotransferase